MLNAIFITLFFMVVGIIIIYNNDKNMKKLATLRANQIKLPKSKKLKLCYLRPSITALVFVLVLIILVGCSNSKNKDKYAMSLMFVTIFVTAMPTCYKDNILYYKKEIDYKYGVINEENETFIPDEIEKTMRQISCRNELSEEDKKEYMKLKKRFCIWSSVNNDIEQRNVISAHMRGGKTKVVDSHISDLEFAKGKNIVNIGSLCTKARDNRGYERRRDDLYITLNLPFSFKYPIEIEKKSNKNKIENIDHFDVLIPKYKNIPFIFCDNKTYAERIMNEEIQKEIAELIAKIGSDYAIKFYDDKIVLVILTVKWSTNFSRIFLKNKNVKDIFEVIDEVTERLSTIATKVELDGFYE